MLNYIKLYYKSLIVETLFMLVLYFLLFGFTNGFTKEFYISLPFALMFFIIAKTLDGYRRFRKYNKKQNEGE